MRLIRHLTVTQTLWYFEVDLTRVQVARCLKGNPVEIGDGHAAVTGDETRRNHCPED